MESETLGYILIGAAVILFLVEVVVPTGGLVGLLGVGSFVAGGILLDVPWWAIALVVIAILAIGAFFTRKVYLAQKQQPVLTGWEEMMGSVGEVRVALQPEGQIFVKGALWRARVDEGAEPIQVGAKAKVREVDGLTLLVEPII